MNKQDLIQKYMMKLADVRGSIDTAIFNGDVPHVQYFHEKMLKEFLSDLEQLKVDNSTSTSTGRNVDVWSTEETF